MAASDINLRFQVQIHLLAPDEGGRPTPIITGYRPVCLATDEAQVETAIGLCELELHGEVRPGETGEGVLGFSAAVSDLARTLLSVGSEVALAEGRQVVGKATVVAVL